MTNADYSKQGNTAFSEEAISLFSELDEKGQRKILELARAMLKHCKDGGTLAEWKLAQPNFMATNAAWTA